MQRFRGMNRKQEMERIIMDTNTNTEVNVDTQGKDGVTTPEVDTTTNTTDVNTEETVTMSKTDYDRAIQSAEDRVRGKLSKEIKELQAKVQELSPVEKTQEQIDLEKRIAKLEESEKEVAAREKRLAFQENLSNKGIDKSLFDYLKDDTDVDALSNVIDEIVKARMKSNGYVPTNHSSDDSVSQEEFDKMSYDKRVEIYQKNPTLYEKLTKRSR